MGKQINYYLGYKDFLQITQAALDCGCIVIKKASGKLMYSQTSDIVTGHEHRYWFYIPASGRMSGKTLHLEAKDIQGHSFNGNTVIEAGFSYRDDKSKTITRSRLFVNSGYYDEQGEYIPRPEYVTKVYNKLVRIVKQIALYTELTDICYNERNPYYLQEYKHKEYITPEYFNLKECNKYKLIT